MGEVNTPAHTEPHPPAALVSEPVSEERPQRGRVTVWSRPQDLKPVPIHFYELDMLMYEMHQPLDFRFHETNGITGYGDHGTVFIFPESKSTYCTTILKKNGFGSAAWPDKHLTISKCHLSCCLQIKIDGLSKAERLELCNKIGLFNSIQNGLNNEELTKKRYDMYERLQIVCCADARLVVII